MRVTKPTGRLKGKIGLAVIREKQQPTNVSPTYPALITNLSSVITGDSIAAGLIGTAISGMNISIKIN